MCEELPQPQHCYELRAVEETPVSRDIPCPVWPTPTPIFWVSSKQTPTTTFILFTPTWTLEYRAQEKFRQVISEEFFKSENARC